MTIPASNSYDWVNHVRGNEDKLFFILGPCAIESEMHCLMMAEKLKVMAEHLDVRLIFKAAFDKANRQSVSSFRGIGMDEGLRVLERVRSDFQLPVVTDVHEAWQVDLVASVTDVIQIPAFLCRQTDLLLAAGRTGKVVHLKKGQFFRADKMNLMVNKIASAGNEKVWLCERGFTFGYSDLIVDMRNFPILKQFGKPVVFDATHAVQRPGDSGACSGGDRQFVACLAAAAVVQGIAGVFMEVHDNPEKALSDGPNMIRLSQLETLLSYLKDLDIMAKQRSVPLVT